MLQKSAIAKGSRDIDPARAITWLVSVTIILLYHFSITFRLHLARFLRDKVV